MLPLFFCIAGRLSAFSPPPFPLRSKDGGENNCTSILNLQKSFIEEVKCLKHFAKCFIQATLNQVYSHPLKRPFLRDIVLIQYLADLSKTFIH